MAFQKKPKKLDATALWDYALRVLGQRAHSASELRRKLVLRAESPQILSDVLVKLREYKYLDDGKFSESYAASRLQNQGFGRLRVLRDLRGKQVSGAIAGEAVAKTFSGVDEAALIDSYLARKYRGKDLKALLKEEKHFAGAYRRLQMAGFSARASIEALKRYASHAEDWEPPQEEVE